MADKKFTWADLKRAANKVPKHLLKKDVIVWTDGGESAHVIRGIERLKEDYLFDGDEGCCPKSMMKEQIAEAKKNGEGEEDEYYLIHAKGTRILTAD